MRNSFSTESQSKIRRSQQRRLTLIDGGKKPINDSFSTESQSKIRPLRQQRLTVIKLIIVLTIIAIGISIFFVSCSEENQSLQFLNNEVNNFIQSTAPNLLIKINNLSKTISEVDTKIQKLTELQNRFPDHSQVTQPRLEKWNRIHTQLTQTQKEIQFQIDRAYVIYKTEQEIEGTQQFTATAQSLIQKADEALNIAKSMTEVIEESANY
jgi:hypothetical protein